MPNGIEEVYEAGKKAEYDRFWDAYQSKGGRNHYDGAFGGICWTVDNFKPKYDIKNFTRAQNMFWSSLMQIDLPAHLESIGIALDFSNTQAMISTFAYSKFTRLGVVDLSKATHTSGVFGRMDNLTTIDKVIVSANTPFDTCFTNDSKLFHVIFEGVIAQNGLNLQWCPLDKESLISIVNSLSTTTSGLTVTLSLAAVNKAFEYGGEGANNGLDSNEWLYYVNSRPNWTFAYA
jgi:hypothetical protein